METSWFLDSPTAGETPANFQLVRRGYDPVEVQSFARSVAAEIERLQEDNLSLKRALADAEARAAAKVDEATVAQFLGQESSRLLVAARDTAADLVKKAEDTSEQLRQEATDDAARMRAEASSDAAATRAAAREDARQLRAETMEHRRLTLVELTRRRDIACAQIGELLRGREILIEALSNVGNISGRLVGDLDSISADPASFVNLDPSVEGPGNVFDQDAVLRVTKEHNGTRGRRGRAAGPAPVNPEIREVSDDVELVLDGAE
jgi:cell division septum initiation protein DivIVA